MQLVRHFRCFRVSRILSAGNAVQKCLVVKTKEIAKIKKLFQKRQGSLGARSMAQMAKDHNVPLSRYRASHLMRKLGLISCQILGHAYNKTGNEHVEIANELDYSSCCTFFDDMNASAVTDKVCIFDLVHTHRCLKLTESVSK